MANADGISETSSRFPGERVHRWCWYAVWVPLGLTSTLLGLTFGSVMAPLGTALLGAVLAAVLAKSAHGRSEASSPTVAHRLLTAASVRRVAVWAGVTAGALSASMTVLGATAWVLAAAAILTSPWMFEAIRSTGGEVRPEPAAASRRPRTRPARPTPAEEVQTLVGALSDAQLLRAWKETQAGLAAASSGAAIHEIVAMRQALLIELERRRPAGAPPWLTALIESSADPEGWLGTGSEDDAA